MITAVLGAPGSGKSAAARPLAALLPTHVVLDWDAFMVPAAALAGREIIQHRETWPAYRQLVGAVVATIAHLPVVLLTVCTPDELPGWPIDAWVPLDSPTRSGGSGWASKPAPIASPRAFTMRRNIALSACR